MYLPQWSPDGQWIAYALDTRDGGQHLVRVPAAGGAPQQLTRTQGFNFRWSRDGKRIYFRASGRGVGDLWQLTLADGTERPVTRFTGRAGQTGDFGLAIATSHLYLTWNSDLGDIWVMDVVTPENQ